VPINLIKSEAVRFLDDTQLSRLSTIHSA